MRPLSGKFADIIYGSDTAWQDHYPDRFRARRGVMLHAVNLAWSLEDCRLTFTNPVNPGSCLWTLGSDDRVLRPAEVTKRLHEDYNVCVARVMVSPAPRNAAEARQILGQITECARMYQWKGRAGRTDRDILSGVLKHATQVGTTRLDVSVRDASLWAGVTIGTASKSLGRLRRDGWLVRTAKGAGAHASTYQCAIPKHIGLCVEVLKDNVFQNGALVAPSHEVWVRLGKAAMSLWSCLDIAPLSARRLARSAGVSPRTADRQLPALASFGMASKTEGGWVVGILGPDDVADAMGWVGDNSKVVARVAQIEVDRAFRRMKPRTSLSAKPAPWNESQGVGQPA